MHVRQRFVVKLDEAVIGLFWRGAEFKVVGRGVDAGEMANGLLSLVLVKALCRRRLEH
jgi:hypothetical protein